MSTNARPRPRLRILALRVVGEWPHVPPGYGVDPEGFVTSPREGRMLFRGWEKALSWLKNNPGFHAEAVETGEWVEV